MSIVEDGFRLAGAPSERSMKSKARIDALFEDTRSVCSSTFGGGWYAEVNLPGALEFVDLDDVGAEEQKRVNSAVQARIEAMFASVEAETGIPGECAAAILPVRYLGAAPVGGRVASVRGLQEPLRNLLGRLEESLPAELEVSRRGLTFRTSESLEKTNPFRRIAVWSALRLRSKSTASGEVHCAFVPLVGDDAVSACGEDKHADLYRTMRGLKKSAISSPPIFAVVMRRPGAVPLLECHAFACQVEEDAVAAAATLYRALLADLDGNRRRPRQTNGVGCVSLASVTSIASSISVREIAGPGEILAGSLSQRPGPPHPVRPPRIKKSSSSSAREEGNSSSSGLENGRTVVKPPDVKKEEDILEARSRRSSVSLANALPLSLGTADVLLSPKILQENKKNLGPNPRASKSPIYGHDNSANRGAGQYEMFKRIGHGGENDYEKFPKMILQTGEYSPRKGDVIYGQKYGSTKSKDSERKLQRDQIFRDADKISSIDPQDEVYAGRSVSTKSSKPRNSASVNKVAEYSQPRPRRVSSRAGSEPPRISSTFSANNQETRLKKAQSDLDLDGGDLMTRVELPRRGSFLNSSCARKPDNFQGGTPLGFTELFDEFRNQEGLTNVDDILAAIIDPEGMSFNDLKPLYKEFLLKLAATLTRDELYERSASIMRRRRRPQRGRTSRRPCLIGRAIKRSVSRLKGGPTEFTSVIFPARKLNDSLGSSSSCDAKNNRNRVLASRLGRKRSSRRRPKPTAVGHTTSEDSDTCRRIGRGIAANRSSSGYVSCSECSYDSESCTCVSADKCYCSLSRRVSSSEAPVATVICSCDTDSCSESNKCYCARKLPVRQPTILEQLRQRGIVPSESTLSRTESPQVVRTLRTNESYSSSRSLEFLKVRPRTQSSSDNLALDYDLFSPGKNPRSTTSSCNSDKVLVVGARDPQGRLIYVGGTGRGKRIPPNGTGRSRAHHEALSIKKSAEIAAVFGNSNKNSRRPSNASSLRSSASLEAGLGYLP